MLLVVVVALLLALVAGTIVWAVEANRRSHRNISLSTYKEAVSLSETDHFFLENVCISASTSPPNSLQVEIAAVECTQPTMTDTNFSIQGVLMKGLQRSADVASFPGLRTAFVASSDAQQKHLVDHNLVFYWNRGTVMKLVTPAIPFQTCLDFDVTVFVLIEETAFIRCADEHIEPKEVFYVKWSVSPSSQQCQVANNGDVTCNFIYNVTQSSMHYICILRKEPVIPPLHTYTYNLTGELKSYNISQARPHTCNLSHPTSPCCAPYRSVFTKTCIVIKTDLPVESEDAGDIFTVTLSSKKRGIVLWLSVGLAIVCFIIALALIFICVATLDKARNVNARNCTCVCHI